MQIYNRIKTLMDKNNVKGSKIAELLNLKKSPMTDWKNGQSKPTLEQVIILCEYFAVTLDYLVLGKEQEKNELTESYKKLSKRDKIKR